MDRRQFCTSTAALTAMSAFPSLAQPSDQASGFPPNVLKNDYYIETTPIDGYSWAPPSAYEAFQDSKFGIRIHWGIYSIWHRGPESWPFLKMSLADRQTYNDLYKTWDPAGFDAGNWMDAFKESGMRMFTFTTKHHEGFSMFDTRTRVTNRANWIAPGGPRIESCDLAYSIMETPFRRDIVKEICDAAHKRDMKIDLYFSHPDWYDADFRPYVQDPLQVPSAANMMIPDDIKRTRQLYADHPVMVPDPTDAVRARMIARHRAQLVELLSNYGKIDSVGLDMYFGPQVWPELRSTVLTLRHIQPDVMLRNRGIGNYGDYYTPERVVPGSRQVSAKPWFTIYPLGTDFSYEPDAAKYKGTEWIVHSLVDAVAKGGGLQIGVGPSAHGEFHPEAIRQMRGAGKWLRVNGEAIYATRAREGTLWSEGESIRYTRSADGRFLFAIFTQWPGTEVRLQSVQPKAGSEVTLLGSREKPAWKFDSARGTVIRLSESLQQSNNRPCEHAWSLRMEV